MERRAMGGPVAQARAAHRRGNGLLARRSRTGAGERVLDVGCGGGRTSLAAGEAVGMAGYVVGADISEPLRALADRRAQEAGAKNVSFRQVDMQTDTVPGGPFDVALSQFGVMFFDEPVTAFGNIRAHLKPGGRLAFACWQTGERIRGSSPRRSPRPATAARARAGEKPDRAICAGERRAHGGHPPLGRLYRRPLDASRARRRRAPRRGR